MDMDMDLIHAGVEYIGPPCLYLGSRVNLVFAPSSGWQYLENIDMVGLLPKKSEDSFGWGCVPFPLHLEEA